MNIWNSIFQRKFGTSTTYFLGHFSLGLEMFSCILPLDFIYKSFWFSNFSHNFSSINTKILKQTIFIITRIKDENGVGRKSCYYKKKLKDIKMSGEGFCLLIYKYFTTISKQCESVCIKSVFKANCFSYAIIELSVHCAHTFNKMNKINWLAESHE